MCGVDGSPGVVGRGNNDGDGAPYRVYPCYKKLLGTQLSNICIKLEKCILKDIYLHHRDDILHPLLVTLQHFIGLVVPALAGPTGQGTKGRMPLSGIGPTVHHPVAQSKPAIKVSIIN
jgi:hypothetical protein